MIHVDEFDRTQIGYISQRLNQRKSEYEQAIVDGQTFVAQLRRQSISDILRTSAKAHTTDWVEANISFLKDAGLG